MPTMSNNHSDSRPDGMHWGDRVPARGVEIRLDGEVAGCYERGEKEGWEAVSRRVILRLRAETET